MMTLRFRLLASLSCLLAGAAFAPGCASDEPAASGSGGAGGAAGAGGAGAGGTAGAAGTAGGGSGGVPVPGPGEQCYDPDPATGQIRFEPAEVVVAPGGTRVVQVVIDPDFCRPTPLTFASSDAAVAAAPASETIDLLNSRFDVTVTGGSVGTAEVTATVTFPDGSVLEKVLPVDVRDATVPSCTGTSTGRLDDGVTVRGTGDLALASIGLQAGGATPNYASMLWGVAPFDVTLGCAPDQVPTGFEALGPAVSFGPEETRLQRELPFTIPINPALMPPAAALRHVTVSYTGPRASTPRVIPIADPRILRDGAGWVLSFKAPWLGTYQAVVKSDGGTVTRTRRLTYKAVIGISMGGGGTAMYGLRNHQRFDVLGPLGGPVDWTWLMGHIERNHIGGFHPNDGTTVPTGYPPLPTATLPYEHPSSFNRWWYEYPRNGNGGRFPREEYVQIFRDLALMFGNPNGQNDAVGGESLPAGVPIDHPSVVGGSTRTGRECAVWIDPLDGPDKATQEELARNCPAERCANPLTLTNYYDDEFNPNGTFPVITVCDGSPQNEALSPYANTWSDSGNNKPLELALAVDYDGDGVRDENEPIIRAGYEPYDDWGTDGVASAAEAGYQVGVNEDPAGDDWHPQYNPTGTEGNFRYDAGEPYRDYGLDGVPNTASSPYDTGEGDGQFTMARGLQTFLSRDSRTVIEQHPWASQAEPFDDAAMNRLDIWTDGGTRDLFNFAVDAQALAGAWAGRNKIVHYYTQFNLIPGQDPAQPRQFRGGAIDFGAVPSGVMMRYGPIDPTPQDINSGTGQHVGTADDVTRRLQAALYFIGSRWKNAPHTWDEAAALNPGEVPPGCNMTTSSCDFEFTDSRGRKGPVSINLPPGYMNAANNKRYPVIFLLHGYGQTPEDLKAAIIFLSNWMNGGLDSSASRMSKAIMVYVDGRCRPGADEAECIRGTFYTDSVRANGPKMEGWFNELVDEIDSRYRTMAPEEVPWTE